MGIHNLQENLTINLEEQVVTEDTPVVSEEETVVSEETPLISEEQAVNEEQAVIQPKPKRGRKKKTT